MENHASTLFTDLTKGALAGALGVWALDRITWFMWNREDPNALAREEAARPLGLDPAHVVAHRARRLAGRTKQPKQPSALGLAVHYSLGIVPGALYGALRKRSRSISAGAGVLFGIGLFLLQDELGNRMLGLSGPAKRYPWQAHARGLIGHAVYGATTDGVLRVLDRSVARHRSGESA